MELDKLQQPIVVVPTDDGRYQILIGQRRFLAAKQLGWDRITARVQQDPLSDIDAKVISFSENAQRRELPPRDKADVCEHLLSELKSISAVANRLGVSEQTVRKWLAYAAVPESMKKLVEQKKLQRSVATRISMSVPDETTAVAVAEKLAETKPPKRERDRILDAAEELPGRPVDLIWQRAKEKQQVRRITFILPDAWTGPMDRAVKQLDLEPPDIAREATIEWLRARRFSDAPGAQ